MNLKKYKPITPSLRQRVIINKTSLNRISKINKLNIGKLKSGGRNNYGRITSYKKGGGHKQLYNLIDFKRDLMNVPARVKDIRYDTNRTAFIALICYNTGVLSYIIAPENLKIGSKVISGEKFAVQVGNSLPLKNILVGVPIHNIELKAGKGGQLARAAGTYAQIINKNLLLGYATVKLSSGQLNLLSLHCFATIGKVSNFYNRQTVLGKAGANRWLGRRPTVRGVAMNPVDHPHGGGEGKTSGGRVSVTPWGFLTKGKPTRKKKKNNFYIIKLK